MTLPSLPKIRQRFFGASQHRAQRISEINWEKHKDDIIDKYSKSDLTETIRWMAKIHGFQASVKQYRHRLDKWAVKKYDSKSRQPSNNDESVPCSSETLQPAMANGSQSVFSTEYTQNTATAPKAEDNIANASRANTGRKRRATFLSAFENLRKIPKDGNNKADQVQELSQNLHPETQMQIKYPSPESYADDYSHKSSPKNTANSGLLVATTSASFNGDPRAPELIRSHSQAVKVTPPISSTSSPAEDNSTFNSEMRSPDWKSFKSLATRIQQKSTRSKHKPKKKKTPINPSSADESSDAVSSMNLSSEAASESSEVAFGDSADNPSEQARAADQVFLPHGYDFIDYSHSSYSSSSHSISSQEPFSRYMSNESVVDDQDTSIPNQFAGLPPGETNEAVINCQETSHPEQLMGWWPGENAEVELWTHGSDEAVINELETSPPSMFCLASSPSTQERFSRYPYACYGQVPYASPRSRFADLGLRVNAEEQFSTYLSNCGVINTEEAALSNQLAGLALEGEY